MLPVVYPIRLDVSKPGSDVCVYVKKGESQSRKLAISLFRGNEPITLDPDTMLAVIRAEKPDGTRVFNECVVTPTGAEIVLTTQMIAVLGTVNCELNIYNAEDVALYSPWFGVEVLDTLYSDEEIESEDEFTALTENLSRIKNIVNTEEERKAAEADRVASEAARKAAESERLENEAARVEAETARIEENAAMKEIVGAVQESYENGDFIGTIEINEVNTGEPGTQVIIENIGTPQHAILNITIPRGIDGTGAGDMMKSTYDADNSGVVDNAERLAGKLPNELISINGTTGDSFTLNAENLAYTESATIAEGIAAVEQGVAENATALSGKAAKAQTFYADILAAAWSTEAPYTQTVVVADMGQPTAPPLAGVFLSDDSVTAALEQEAWNAVSRVDVGSGSVTVTCFDALPETDFTLRLVVIG